MKRNFSAHAWRCAAFRLALGTSAIAIITAATEASAAPATSTVGQVVFDIPAGPVATALNLWAERAGLKLLAPTETLRGLETKGVAGSFTPSQALARLLAGSGLSYRFTSATTVTIERAQASADAFYAQASGVQLETINVQGAGNPLSTMTPMPVYAGGQVATGGTVGMLGNSSVMDTPFNQTSFTSQTIQDQQARTIADVLQNDPSIRFAMAGGNGQDQYFIRGFLVNQNDFGLNGLYGIVPTFGASADYAERVEVLKGPSTLLNGMPPSGAVGGSVNIVTKRAGDVPLTQFTTEYVSKTQFGEHVDIGRRFGQDNAFGVRINGTYRNGDTPIDRNKNELGSVALGLDFRSDRVRLSGDFGYQVNNIDGTVRQTYLSSTLIGVPAAPNATSNYQPPWGYQHLNDTFGMFQGEFDITKDLTAYAAIGAHANNFHYKSYIYDFVSDQLGNFTAKSYDDILYYKNTAAQTGLRWSLDTGPVHHLVNFNASEVESTYGLGYTISPTVYSGNLYTSPYGPETLTTLPTARNSAITKLGSLGVSDTASILNNRIQVTAGVRRQQVGVDSFNAGPVTATGALTSSYAESAWSPAFAAVVKPLENVSLYANYIQGLQQGTVVGSTYANAGAVLPPYVTDQIETGVKVDWGRIMTTVSLFQITQPQTVSVAGVGGALATLALNGKQRNRGVEFESAGELMPGVRLLGGVTFLDGRQTATAGHATDGLKAIGVPDVQLNLGAEWDTPFFPGFTVTGRMIYTGEEYNDTANLQKLPDWTRIDLGARYTFLGPWNKPVVVRLNVENVLDKSYWSQSYNGGLQLNSPRTFILSTTMNF